MREDFNLNGEMSESTKEKEMKTAITILQMALLSVLSHGHFPDRCFGTYILRENISRQIFC
jgi:hypothetical protein